MDKSFLAYVSQTVSTKIGILICTVSFFLVGDLRDIYHSLLL